MRALVSAAAAAALISLVPARGAESTATFGDDLKFLRRHVDVIELRDAAGRARIAVVPAYQARVMTSTAATDYVNSMWELQDVPFAGDVVNSYNDDGKLGRFYELETSSPALAPGAAATHRHQTIHLHGTTAELDGIARATLGIGLAAIRLVFNP